MEKKWLSIKIESKSKWRINGYQYKTRIKKFDLDSDDYFTLTAITSNEQLTD